MKKKEVHVLIYARVSLEIQADANSASVDQQLIEMRQMCLQKDWTISKEYIDTSNYIATQNPNRGKLVNPSGERSDRPQFLAMLLDISSGNFDFVICWRDDRLIRHPRAEVALEDALDEGDLKRAGRPKIQIYEASGSLLDRFTLGIKASVWREENRRRVERGQLGKSFTLQSGRWCGEFRRYGYKAVKIHGARGREIVIDPEMAPTVKMMFEMYASGYRVTDIRNHLIEINAAQIYKTLVRHKWSRPLILKVLQSEEYLGEAHWKFADGTTYKVAIPPLIDADLWHRVQNRIERNRNLSPRNSKGVYPLQGLLFCGECGHMLSVGKMACYSSFRFGERNGHGYRCHNSDHNPHESHPKPACHNGSKIDWVIWRFAVDEILKKPDAVILQIKLKVKKLQNESENVEGEIQIIENRLFELSTARAFYQRKAATGLMNEDEFDARMKETLAETERLRNELSRLMALRQDNQLVQNSIDYITALFEKILMQVNGIDVPPETIADMKIEQRWEIFREWRILFDTLIERILVFSDGRLSLKCSIDGSEALRYELPVH